VWLVVETQRRKWKKTGKEKKIGIGGKSDFSQTLTSNFLLLNARNPPLFIRGWKRGIFLHWGPILALDLGGKDHNC
jgi:hypothetical protein